MSHKVVFIDWAGTLSSSPFWSDWQAQQPKKWGMIQGFFASNGTIVVDWMRGKETAESVSKKIAKQTALDKSEVFSELKRSCKEMELIDTSALEHIAKLRGAGTKVVIATDNMDTFQRWTVPALRLNRHFDDILDSFSLQVLKADLDEQGGSSFFMPYLQTKGIETSQTALFDDNAPYVKEFGISYFEVGPSKPLAARLQNYIRLQPYQ